MGITCRVPLKNRTRPAYAQWLGGAIRVYTQRRRPTCWTRSRVPTGYVYTITSYNTRSDIITNARGVYIYITMCTPVIRPHFAEKDRSRPRHSRSSVSFCCRPSPTDKPRKRSGLLFSPSAGRMLTYGRTNGYCSGPQPSGRRCTPLLDTIFASSKTLGFTRTGYGLIVDHH